MRARFAVRCAVALLSLGALFNLAVGAEDTASTGPMVAHTVYFSLAEPTEEAKQALLDDIRTLLAPIPGMVFFAAGVRSPIEGPVNDKEFDVALYCVFTDHAALKAYSAHPSHLQYVAKNRAGWKAVRVFDADVAGGAVRPPAAP